jgi:hypothetical protein
MNRTGWTFVTLTVCLVVAADARAQNGAVKAIFEKYDLVGNFAPDCSRPPSRDNIYFVNRVLGPDLLQRDVMSGPSTRELVLMVDKVAEAKPNEVSFSGTIDGSNAATGSWRVEKGRMLQLEATAAGEVIITNRRWVRSGSETPWLNKCQ